MTPSEFSIAIEKVCRADTSSHPEEWTEENPFLGHCTVVSILAQDVFGGDILRADLRETPGWEKIGWHSWNRLPDGAEFDFTKSQLQSEVPRAPTRVCSREELFTYSNIKERYELLKKRFSGV